jgi:exosortase
MSTEATATPTARPGMIEELRSCWHQLPYKPLFFGLAALWLGLFHFLGNSTLGYVETPSLFGWLHWIYGRSVDDEHGRLIPFVVLALFWWKRDELLAVPKSPWWPALLVVLFGLALHIFGFVVQQARISVVGFFVGLFGLTGVAWGFRWLRSSFFPFFLFAFCLPLSGGPAETISFPLRLLATRITAVFSQTGLGINVIQDGSRIFDASGSYQYEVAAACSGMRSLTATVAIALIYAFVAFKSPWRRILMIASAVPLAVAANVVRLTTIIIAAEAFGQDAGNYVHNSSWLSLLPYIPAIAGVLFLGHLLREDRPKRAAASDPLIVAASRESAEAAQQSV